MILLEKKRLPKSFPLEGGSSARKTIQWIIFSEGRAAALDGDAKRRMRCLFSEGRAAAPDAVRRGDKMESVFMTIRA